MHAKRLVCYFQGQGHSKGSYDQNVKVSTIFAELLILLLAKLEKWDCWIQCQGHSKFQNVNECLSRRYLLNC